MVARLLRGEDDSILPIQPNPLTITVDDVPVQGLKGQTLAGVILASGSLAWRRTSAEGKPRGVFCAIGVCFDCLVEVNGQRDVRACLRRAIDGDVLRIQHDELPETFTGTGTGTGTGTDTDADTASGTDSGVGADGQGDTR